MKKSVLYSVGYHGPKILFTLLVFIIIKTNLTNVINLTNHLLFVFLINAFNIELNMVLKHLIKQPRPQRAIKINKQDVKHSKTYGMPSGHAQLVFHNLVYLSLLIKNNTIAAASSFIALLTLYQRYVFRMHTFSQLICGSLLGSLSGYLFYKAYVCISNCNTQNDIKSANIKNIQSNETYDNHYAKSYYLTQDNHSNNHRDR